MRFRHQLVTYLTTAAILAAPLTFGACYDGYRVYDSNYGRSVRWNRAEDRRYRQWEVERRLPHVDFARRWVEDQHAYFDWRHRR